jgi:hypothetical protein
MEGNLQDVDEDQRVRNKEDVHDFRANTASIKRTVTTAVAEAPHQAQGAVENRLSLQESRKKVRGDTAQLQD